CASSVFFSGSGPHRALHSFPTRRSSDLSGTSGGIVRFAGREYLAVTRPAKPYQGYAGPAWRGHVMVPVERAFEVLAHHTQLRCRDRKSTRLNSSHVEISYAVFCLKKKNK